MYVCMYMNFQKIKRKYIYLFISISFHYFIIDPSIPFYYSIIINLEYNMYIFLIINDMIYCDCRMIKKVLL